jgi:acetyl-CoA carboxylase biotin carboxyl carrier protein
VNLNEVKNILELIREYELAELEIEHEGLRLRIRRDAVAAAAVAAPPSASAVNVPPVVAAPAAPSIGVPSPAADETIELAVVKSPIVGTFYRSPEPTAPSFVEVGTVVKKGQVLCIIEAMKLMNEIDSEYDGEIVSIYVENGQPVQYGERLFAIRTA